MCLHLTDASATENTLKGKVIWIDEAEMAEKLVVPAEKYPEVQHALEVSKKVLSECESKNTDKDKIIEDKTLQLKEAQDAIDKFERLSDDQEKECKKRVDAVQPTFLEKAQFATVFAVIGAIGAFLFML